MPKLAPLPWPHQDKPRHAIMPKINGDPVVASVDAIMRSSRMGDSMADIAASYGVEPVEIEQIIRAETPGRTRPWRP